MATILETVKGSLAIYQDRTHYYHSSKPPESWVEGKRLNDRSPALPVDLFYAWQLKCICRALI